jgi:regulatory protein
MATVRTPRPLDPERAWDYLLYLLGRRDHTVDELRRRLLRRGIDEARAEALLVRLAELGLVNDRAFSERYVAARGRTRGRLAVSAELRRKGVAEELVERATEALSPERQREAAASLLQRFAWRYRPAAPAGPDAAREELEALRRSRARAFAFLARRGFTPEIATHAVEALGWWEDV